MSVHDDIQECLSAKTDPERPASTTHTSHKSKIFFSKSLKSLESGRKISKFLKRYPGNFETQSRIFETLSGKFQEHNPKSSEI